MSKRKLAHFSPARVILYSFFFLILLGTALLALPISRTKPIPLIDLLFTSTSATCITGLFTIPLSDFTRFGQSIILGLIQIGALGLVTMSLFVLSLFVNLGLATRLMAGQLLELEPWQNIKRVLIFIFLGTIVTEIIGALCIFTVFKTHYPINDAYYYSIFHSISSFCNAGISFLHHISEQNLELYNTSYIFLITTGALMFFGGLGFITWREIIRYFRTFFSPKRHRFSLHSKIILYGSGVLLVTTAILFWILEHDNVLAPLNTPQTIVNALFHVIAFKSCGFITSSLLNLNIATLLFIMIIGLIGSSPGSTGSGIKITNIAIFLSTIKAAISGRSSVEITGRSIPKDQVYKAIAIVSLSIGWIILITFCLLITEHGWRFIDLLFEVTAAYTNVGFSIGGTDRLTIIGKLFIIATMFIGRIGTLTMILGLKMRKRKETAGFTYPEERVMLG